MDNTETYIKMAECPEIQDGWQPKTADFYCYANKIHTVRNYLADQVKTYGDIWLPTQFQLQEMLEVRKGDAQISTALTELLGDFLEFASPYNELYVPEYTKQFTSMEQLWLAFVMKERWNKTWNGSEWVSEKD